MSHKDPMISRGTTFTLTNWAINSTGKSIAFSYECSRFGPFTEEVSFPFEARALQPTEEMSRLLDLLHIALGVSYYKAAAAEKIELPVATPAAIEMARLLYTEGLAEFFVRAGLDYPVATTFKTKPKNHKTAKSHAPEPSDIECLIAFGGGKDSYVAKAISDQAGYKAALCSVTLSPRVETILQGTAPEPLIFLHRKLDPKIRTLDPAKAFNGHIPITAINSLMLVIFAKIMGMRQVVFANERSADEPTMDLNGVVANHQYSKSGAFEKALRAAIQEADPDAPDYFSILRPFSEIWIAKTMAKLKTPFDRFTSCNKNFQIVAGETARWCGDCAKCAFTSLLLAPHLSEADMDKIFPSTFLNEDKLLPYYEELCGLTEIKPWDCVGTIDECRAALYQLSLNPIWSQSKTVTTLLPRLLQETTPYALTREWANGLMPADAHFVPDALMKAAHDLS